jgi:hypothetical protein
MKLFIQYFSLLASRFITKNLKNYDTINKLLLTKARGGFLFANFSIMKNILMCSVGSYVDIANSDDFNCLNV